MLLDTIKELCALSGPSSYETPVRNYICRRAKATGCEMRVDGMGSLIVTKKRAVPGTKKLMLTAHMDEVGLIVKRITDDGYIKFACLGDIDRRVLIGKQIWLGKSRVPGVIGMKAVHLTAAAERGVIPKLESLYIDIGARDRAEAESLTHLGDFAVFTDDVQDFGHGMLKAKALDDRVGCAIMVELFERELPMDCTFAFTVQEEVGNRGAFGAGFSVKPDLALVLEGTNAADSPATDNHLQICTPGKGPVIPYMDEVSISDRAMFELLRTLADEHNIPWQTKECITGGTDAGAIQRSRGGVRVAVLAAPVRYICSPAWVGASEDFYNMQKLTECFILAVADGRI